MEKYQDICLSNAERAADLAAHMTTAEKLSQLQSESPAISRLGVPPCNWWSEALHGMARNGTATVFPQALALAATFDEDLMHEVASAISDEVRGRWNEAREQYEATEDPNRLIFRGLNICAPNINLFRDPRWGRGHETYGEDPYLTARMGVAYIKGLQGDDPQHHKTDAIAKHFVVHSGPEQLRHEINPDVDEKTFRETYLYAFAAAVREADTASIMGAYNRFRNEPCSGSKSLLTKLLREELGFRGYVVSDAGAVGDFHLHHKVTANEAQSAAMALSAGCNLNIGYTFRELPRAYEEGLITDADIDRAILPLLEARFRLGMFDPKGSSPWDSLSEDDICTPAHSELAMEAARRAIVLLKNENNLLPLRMGTKIAVIGPNADSRDLLLGNYNGTPKVYSTLLSGIIEAAGEENVIYAEGCDYTRIPHGWDRDPFPEAVVAAKRADVYVLCLGNTALMEGEEGAGSEDDRRAINLPEVQKILLRTVAAVGKPVILVLGNGGAVTLTDVEDLCGAILDVWYPGQAGGAALGEILFGLTNPSGRMPVSAVRALEDLPPFEDYSMDNRTYRYAERPMEFPFGFGLSYTKFDFTNPVLEPVGDPLESVKLRVTVTNAGDFDGTAPVQVYLAHKSTRVNAPKLALCALKCVKLEAEAGETIAIELPARNLATVQADGSCLVEAGEYTLYVGTTAPDEVSCTRAGVKPLEVSFTVRQDIPVAY